jgi:acyl-CoA synthetase (NDP forming)
MASHPGAPDLDSIRAIAAAARAEDRTTLLEPEGLALLAAAGIAVPRWHFVRHAGALDAVPLADFRGDRVVVKVVSGEIVHKTEVGGVAIVPRDRVAVALAIEEMATRLGGAGDASPAEPAGDVSIEGYLVAEHVEHDASLGGELLISLRWTDDFGPVVSVGAGGVHTEALAADLRPGREIAIVSPTLTPPGILGAVLGESTAIRLATTSQRGQPASLPLERLVEVVERLLVLGERLVPAELRELEINPAAVRAGGLVALDVLVSIGDGSTSSRAGRPTHKLGRLLEPRTIAIVGVSSGINPGHVILGNLLREGFEPGRIVIVKPGRDEIDGVRCVPDLAAMPGKVDLFVVAVSAAQAPGFVAEVIERDLAESLIVIPGGLEEKHGGEALAARMREALARARASADGGPLINGGNCLGIRSRPGRYDTLFIPTWKLPPGPVAAPIALVTGSGAFAVTRLSRLGRLDPRYVVTVGNQMDLTIGDYLAHLRNDPSIRVFGVYLEGFMPLDGARFLQAAAEITAEGRAVVLYRAGRTTAGARASASHTAAIAGDATVTRELARQAGVALADTPEAFDDLVRTFTLLEGRRAAGRRLGAVTNAGSECVTIADHLGPLELPAFEAETERRLVSVLAPAGIDAVVDIHNPLDLTPIADAAVYEAVVRAVLDAGDLDIGLVGVVPITDTLEALAPGPGHDEDLDRAGAVAARLEAVWGETTKPWAVVVDAGPLYDPFVRRLDAAAIPTFRAADAATRSLAAFCDLSLRRDVKGR